MPRTNKIVLLLLALGILAPLLTLGMDALYPLFTRNDTVLHTERSLYRNITVYENDGERCMRFSRNSQSTNRQTCISLQDPDRMVISYTKMMMAALYLLPAPDKILIIGLGGGTLPYALSKILPHSEIDSVEIDPAVVRVAKKYFNFQTNSRMKVIEEDGRVFVKRALKKGVKYDLIMLDAFDHQYIPEHLLTREFLDEVKQIMNPEGVLAANTFSTSRLYDHESATYESVFGTFLNLKHRNRVILIKKGALPPKETIRRNAAMLEAALRPFHDEADFLLPLFSTDRDWDVNAKILSDQYSPSNLLNDMTR